MTTRTTVLMEVVPADGTAAWTDSYQSTPPSAFGDSIPGSCPVRIGHTGPTIGFLDYAEHHMGHGDGQLYAVATVEGVPAEMIDGKVQASAEIRANGLARNVETVEWVPDARSMYHMRTGMKSVGDMYATTAHLDGVAFCDETASITSFRCRAWDGDFRSPADRGRWNMRDIPDIIKRAIAAADTLNLRHRRPDTLRIHQPADVDRLDDQFRHGGRSEIVHHGGGRVLSVRSA